jgi:chromate transporter, chromate ion transporter (CHR) family
LPSFLLMWLASYLVIAGGLLAQSGVLDGLKAVAVAVVAQALLGMSKSLCPDKQRMVLSIAAAILMMIVQSLWMQLIIIAGGAIYGATFLTSQQAHDTKVVAQTRSQYVAWTALGIFVFIFVGLTVMRAQTDSSLWILADTMYRAGALVFGGGHVVLPMLETGTVGADLISKDAFLAGYGVAQAIPGPLFTFGSYLGGTIPTSMGSFLTSLMATILIFLPGMLLLVGCLPFWQKISGNKSAQSALMGVNACVVGLLMAGFFDPVARAGLPDGIHAAIALAAFAALHLGKAPPWLVVAGGALIGYALL